MARYNAVSFVLLMVVALWRCWVLAEIDAMTGQECVDDHNNCPFWAATGECEKNPKWMRENCRLSCDRCKYIRVGSTEEMNAFLAHKKQELLEKKRAEDALKAEL